MQVPLGLQDLLKCDASAITCPTGHNIFKTNFLSHVEVISRIKIIALGETLVISGAPNDQMFSNVSEVFQMVFSMLRETLVNLKLP